METIGNSDELRMDKLLRLQVGTGSVLIGRPESNILLFRRPVGTDGTTGLVDPVLADKVKEKFRREYGLK